MVVVVVAAVVFFALREYKASMYQQLLRRSFNTLQTVSDRFQAGLWTPTGLFRGMGRKVPGPDAPLANELVYRIEKIFDDILMNDPAVSYFILYTRAGPLVYPSVPPAKQLALKTDAKTIGHVEHVGAKFNGRTGFIETYRAVVDKERNTWAWIEMGVDPAVVQKGIVRTIWSSIAIALVCCLAGIFGAVRFAHVLLVPIQRLRGAAQAISDGDLAQRAAITTTDEIADLSRSFNRMAERLEKRIEDLHSLQLLSTEISSQLDQNDLFQVLSQTFSKIVHAEFCAILLNEPRTRTFMLAAGIGVVKADIAITRESPVVSSILAQTRDVLTDTARAGDIAQMFVENGSPEAVPLIGLPFVYDGQVQSVILLGGKNIRTDDEDLALYRTLAGHASISLQNARLYQLAITDGLTGLYLRRHFLFELDRLQNPPADDGRMAILMADIDHFKKVNDTFGHPEGDFILVNIARTFLNTLRTRDVRGIDRPHDMVGRYGGEEFIALLRNVDPDTARLVGERLRTAIEAQAYKSEKHEHRITASIGVCPYRPGLNVEQWIDLADQALYRSKSDGRNRVTVHA